MAEISRDSIIKLDHFLDKEILINFAGGRVVEGKLKGFDHLNNPTAGPSRDRPCLWM